MLIQLFCPVCLFNFFLHFHVCNLELFKQRLQVWFYVPNGRTCVRSSQPKENNFVFFSHAARNMLELIYPCSDAAQHQVSQTATAFHP